MTRWAVSELPKGWVETALGELVVFNPKLTLDDETEIGFVPMSHAPTNFRDKLNYDTRSWGEVRKAYTHFANGDVIFAKVTPCFENGKAAVVRDLPNARGAGSSEFHVLRPVLPDISPTYLLAIIKSAEFLREGEAAMTGAVGLRRVPRSFVESFPVRLPPVAEQARIAQALDGLLAQVDTLKARLDALPALIKRFRQSVLSAAVSSQLTKDWREKGAPINDSIHNNENNLPPSWRKNKIQTLVNKLDQGWSPKCESTAVTQSEEKWAVIKTTAIQAIEFHPEENKRLPEYLTPRPELSLRSGDLLITRAGPRSRAAICCYVKNDHPYLMVCDKAYRFKANMQIMEGKLLCLFLNSPEYIEILDSLKTGISESGMNLTMRKFENLHIPTPPKDEQVEIVRRVEQLFAFADQLEARLTDARTHVDALTQSILAKAFRGELVHQDPADEPASVLLERITAKRAAAPKPKRGRKSV